MGFKAHPIGLRLGLHRKWKSNWFFDSKNYTKFIHLSLDIENFIKGLLKSFPIKTLLINCQLIKLATNQLFIFIFYYRLRKKFKKPLLKGRFFWKSNLKLERWRLILNKFFLTRLKKNKSNNYLNLKLFQFFLKKMLNNFKFSNALTKPAIMLKKSNYFYESFLHKNFKNYVKIFIIIKNKFKNYYLNINLILKIIFKLKNNQKFKQHFKLFFNKIIFKIKVLKIINKYFLYNLKNLNKFCIKNLFFKNYKNILSLYNNLYLKNNFKTFKNFEYLYKFLKSFYKKNLYYKKFFNKKYLNKKFKNTLINIKYNKKLKIFKTKNLNLFFFKKIQNKNKFKKQKKVFSQFELYGSFSATKKFLTKLLNFKVNLIFINTLSFTKFFYIFSAGKKKTGKKKKTEKYNVLEMQRVMINRYKYDVIFIKDFIHIAFICILFKNLTCLVWFISQQFKYLPKNRKQFKLLNFIQKSLKIFCQQRKEFLGFKFQLKGCLNRRNRTNTWNFKKGLLPIQTHKTRVEYSFSKGWTRRGAIGIKLWFFYKRSFKSRFKKRFLEYIFYTKYKQNIKTNLKLQQKQQVIKPKLFINAKTKSKKI